jgi:hypothetical protein
LKNINSHSDLKILLILLGILGLLLIITTVRGAFIIDEINYMVNVIGLRDGTVKVSGTDGLSPSKELLYFDPEPFDRIVTSTPVSSLAPPLYGPLALPFIIFGWRGLSFINTFSFIFSALLVFLIVRRNTEEMFSAWLAVSLFVLGGYSLEYAQGVWPHMLSVLLCLGAVYCIILAWNGGNSIYSLLGGFFAGLACGIREQNIFLAACFGLTVLLWGNHRFRSAALYLAGIAVPMLASATLNWLRLGVFYPTPKVHSYAQFVTGTVSSGTWLKPIEVFLVKIVDFSSFAWFQNPADFVDYSKEPSTGAFLVAGIVKKALVQSSPWLALAIVLCIVNWVGKQKAFEHQKKILRPLSLLILLPLAMFSMSGFRMDGLSFNQRYLLEIIPIAAIVVALCLDGLSIPKFGIMGGFLVAALSCAILLMLPTAQFLHIAVLRVPLFLGSVLALAWFFVSRKFTKEFFVVVLGLCIGWSFLVQTIDLAASRKIRTTNAIGLDSLDARIPSHSALFTFWGAQKSMAGPLQLTKDVIILDAWADMGADARALTRELIQQERKVFLFGTGMPSNIVQEIRGQDSLSLVLTKPFVLYEFIDTGRRIDSLSSMKSNPSHSRRRINEE